MSQMMLEEIDKSMGPLGLPGTEKLMGPLDTNEEQTNQCASWV